MGFRETKHEERERETSSSAGASSKRGGVFLGFFISLVRWPFFFFSLVHTYFAISLSFRVREKHRTSFSASPPFPGRMLQGPLSALRCVLIDCISALPALKRRDRGKRGKDKRSSLLFCCHRHRREKEKNLPFFCESLPLPPPPSLRLRLSHHNNNPSSVSLPLPFSPAESPGNACSTLDSERQTNKGRARERKKKGA